MLNLTTFTTKNLLRIYFSNKEYIHVEASGLKCTSDIFTFPKRELIPLDDSIRYQIELLLLMRHPDFRDISPNHNPNSGFSYQKYTALRKVIRNLYNRGAQLDIHRERARMVKQLSKPGKEILGNMTEADAHNLHMAMGVAGEAGEVVDLIKKSIIYNKVISKEDLVTEIGDLEFYIQGIKQGYGITDAEVIQANLHKLLKGDNARYSSGSYSDQQAQNRADINKESK